MVVLVIISGLILLLSFLASSMEAALFSVTPIQVEQMCEKKLPGALALKKNKTEIHDSIIAIVIMNNLANIAGSILVGSIASSQFDDIWLGIFSGALTFIIIFFGEVLPKTIGEQHAQTYARKTSGIVSLLRIILKPIIFLTRLFIMPSNSSVVSRDRVSEEEITMLAKMGHHHGAILESENQLIRQVFQLNDILARDIMTPRTVIFALQADQSLSEISDDLFKASVSRIPIYEDDLDEIIGTAHIRDLLSALVKNQGEKQMRDFAETVAFIPDTSKADALLKLFQKNREHIAIVIDEYGGTAGLITLEDILEQLVGEIVDEYDKDVDMRVKARILTERTKKF